MQLNLRSKLKKVLFSLVAFLLTLVVCELLLRVFDVRYHPLNVEIDGAKTDWRLDHAFDDRHFVYDPKLIWRPKKNFSVFNSQGFRGEELPEQKQADEYRIFTVGDSNTLGNLEASWPADLQDMLTARLDPSSISTKATTRYSFTNAGVWGYSSFQGRQQLREVLAYRPDMVMVSFGSNDAAMVGLPDKDFTSTLFESAIGTTRIGQLTLQVWYNLAAFGRDIDEQKFVHRVSLDEYRENLREIVHACKAAGVECVLLTRPFTGDCNDSPRPELWWKHFAPQYVEATLEVAEENGVTAVDVYARFKEEQDLFEDESHFTKAGYRLAAEFIYEQIQPQLPE